MESQQDAVPAIDMMLTAPFCTIQLMSGLWRQDFETDGTELDSRCYDIPKCFCWSANYAFLQVGNDFTAWH